MTTHGRAAAGPRLGVLVPQDRSPRRAAARGSCFSAVQSERGSGLGSAGLPCPARSAGAVGPRACHGAGGSATAPRPLPRGERAVRGGDDSALCSLG